MIILTDKWKWQVKTNLTLNRKKTYFCLITIWNFNYTEKLRFHAIWIHEWMSMKVLQTFTIHKHWRVSAAQASSQINPSPHLRHCPLDLMKSLHGKTIQQKNSFWLFLSWCVCLLWGSPAISPVFFPKGWKLLPPCFTVPKQAKTAWGFGNNHLNLPPLVTPDNNTDLPLSHLDERRK